MTAFGFLSVAPVIEGSMSGEVAKAVAAIEDHDVGYQTTPMGTIIEAEDPADLFGAAADAHAAVDADRVETFLKIDDKRAVEQAAGEKVESVAEELGHDPEQDFEE
ncbi:thiamine-binding protein [Halorhabdus salina]|uniref:thiamine-binding protein n=1 Tax=Halorhabdus salina TaxID=2750670 RepID=UPI0015EED166|nr:thiamine-binding protein [Halorhabdus salina]